MDYEGRICRSPMEKGSYMLPVTVGCPYNGCHFCNLFRDLRYRELPFSQIEEELLRVKNAGGKPKKIFLGDGCAFGMKTEQLLRILELIHRYFPECDTINSDATVTSIRLKTDEELKALAKNGYKHLYVGIESGLPDVLSFMHKEHNVEEAEHEIARIQKAGMVYDAHIMSGVAGKGRGIENAEALAAFLNHTKPEFVVNFSMFISSDTPLYHDIVKGSFHPATELENLKEDRRLVELLATDGNALFYDSFHDCIRKRVRGNLPVDREKMLCQLDNLIEELEKKESIYATDFSYRGYPAQTMFDLENIL